MISRHTFEEARGRRVIASDAPVALMFTDIEGFTAKAMAMGERIRPALGIYLAEMSRCAVEHGGDIDKFIGDAIFAYFHDPHDYSGAANMAFDATAAMARCEKILSESVGEWDACFEDNAEGRKLRRFRTRFGLHWGKVVVGSFGSLERADSTLIGDNVNLTARMEGLNKNYGTYFLLTEDFYRQLSIERRIQCRCVDRVTVAGREKEPIFIYVIDMMKMPEAFVSRFAEALRGLLGGEWQRAYDDFSAAQKIVLESGMPADGPTRSLMERIDETNSFWKKAVQHLGDRVPDLFTRATAAKISAEFSSKNYLPPRNWPGYWKHQKSD